MSLRILGPGALSSQTYPNNSWGTKTVFKLELKVLCLSTGTGSKLLFQE